jgi:hypothetical protein
MSWRAIALVAGLTSSACTDRVQRDTSEDTAVTDSAARAPTGWLYLVDAGGDVSRILRVRLDGSGVDTVLRAAAPASRGIVLDAANRTLLWASRDGDRIQRARLEGGTFTETTDFPAQGLDSAYAVALHAGRGHLYWTDYGTGAIHRANLDGSDAQIIVRGLTAPRGMDLDTIDGWIYWTDVGTKQVQRARLDGTGVEELLQAQHGLDQPYGVTLDHKNNFMYVTDAGTGNILRARPDGTASQVLIPRSGPHPSFLIVLDDEGRMYWGDNRANRVRRARLDGTQIEDVIPGGLAGPRGLVYVR